MDAIVVLGMLVALAVAAPRWGWDSTDGVCSPEWERRAAWRAHRTHPVGSAGDGAPPG